MCFETISSDRFINCADFCTPDLLIKNSEENVCHADIITSINEVVKIHEEGSKRRAEAQVELAKIEDELKQALLEAGAK